MNASPLLEQTPLIPRADLFGNPERTSLRISPDGQYLAWLAPHHGVMNISIAPRANPRQVRVLTADTHRGILKMIWACDSRHVLFQQDDGGNERWHVLAVGIEGGAARDLTPGKDVVAYFARGSRTRRGEILVLVHQRDPRFGDLYAIDVASGARHLVLENPGFGGFVTDDDYRVLLASKMQADGSVDYLKPAGAAWEPWITVPPDDASAGAVPSHASADGRTLYFFDSRGRDKAALVAFDLAAARAGAGRVLAEDPRADVTAAGLINHMETHAPLAYSVSWERREFHALQDGVREDLAFLDAQGLDSWTVSSRSEADDLWTVDANSGSRAPATYLYHRDERRLEPLLEIRPRLATAPMARMQSATLMSRDGLKLVSYLTLPRHVDSGGELSVTRRVPLVLYIHGGPWMRDEYGYHPYHQWLANRGYAVLSVNYRGSTGFGKAFVAASDGEWGRGMDDDLLDAVDWAVARGIADPQRICIFGASYAGYAVLASMTRNPGRYACGVDLVGPSNLETFYASLPKYWEFMRARWHRALGDPGTPEGLALMRERSPCHQAGRIRQPLLIGHGANDPRVTQAESDQMVAALKHNGIPVTYLVYPDEGHGFARPPNTLAFSAVAEMFLARHLGGRCEPVQAGEIEGHTTRVFEDGGLQLPLNRSHS